MVSNIQTIPNQNLNYGPLLGSGGFGEVYQGTYRGGAVAIKRLINQQLTEQAEQEFQNEQNAMAGMRHPNVITFYGVCPSPLSLVMELMPQSLYQLLHSRQDLPWKVRYQISGDIANGLWYIHEDKNIIHRDLKSLNVLIDDRLRAKITDFGLAKVKADSKTMSTKIQGVGSILWMAPEQFGFKPKHSKASDIFSYAIVLREIASRKIPYEGADLSEVKDCVKSGEREERPPDCPQRFWELITDCWKQEAEQRPRIVQVQARCVELLQEEDLQVEERVKTGFQDPPASLKQSSQVPMETRPMQVIAQLRSNFIPFENGEEVPKARVFMGIATNNLEAKVFRAFKKAPIWRYIVEGLNLEAKCKTSECDAYDKFVWIQKGYGEFDIVEIVFNRTLCPICEQGTEDVANFGFLNCNYVIKGKQIKPERQKIELRDTAPEGGVTTFESGEANWISMQITTEKF